MGEGHEADAHSLAPESRARIAAEIIADVGIALLLLCDRIGRGQAREERGPLPGRGVARSPGSPDVKVFRGPARLIRGAWKGRSGGGRHPGPRAGAARCGAPPPQQMFAKPDPLSNARTEELLQLDPIPAHETVELEVPFIAKYQHGGKLPATRPT